MCVVWHWRGRYVWRDTGGVGTCGVHWWGGCMWRGTGGAGACGVHWRGRCIAAHLSPCPASRAVGLQDQGGKEVCLSSRNHALQSLFFPSGRVRGLDPSGVYPITQWDGRWDWQKFSLCRDDSGTFVNKNSGSSIALNCPLQVQGVWLSAPRSPPAQDLL